jgi:hypothetical protein
VQVDSEAHHHAASHRLCREEGDILALAQVAERTLGRSVHESLAALLGRPGRESTMVTPQPPRPTARWRATSAGVRRSLTTLLGWYVDADEIERPTGRRRDEASLSFQRAGRRYRLLHHPTSVTSRGQRPAPRKTKAELLGRKPRRVDAEEAAPRHDHRTDTTGVTVPAAQSLRWRGRRRRNSSALTACPMPSCVPRWRRCSGTFARRSCRGRRRRLTHAPRRQIPHDEPGDCGRHA